ncbi:MAG: hypothetical protein ACRDG4_12080, partial [Chloroflexota bacterium]
LDTAPGVTLSSSRSVLIDAGNDKGVFTQGDSTLAHDNNLAPKAGLSLQPGSYSGTLQYTITG